MSRQAADVLVQPFRKRGLLGSLRVLLVCAFFAALLVLARPTPAWVLAGAVPVAVGMWWRFWAAGHLLKTKELALSGPYRYVQNPLYFGRLCIATGLCLMAEISVEAFGRSVPLNLVFLAAFWAVFFGYYIPRKVRVEGGRLAALHGAAYTAWAARVPLVLPRLTPFGTNVRRWSRERFDELNEAWMLSLVAGVVLACAWKAGLLGGG